VDKTNEIESYKFVYPLPPMLFEGLAMSPLLHDSFVILSCVSCLKFQVPKIHK